MMLICASMEGGNAAVTKGLSVIVLRYYGSVVMGMNC